MQGNFKSAGLVTAHHALTQLGQAALQQSKVTAKAMEPYRRPVPLGSPGSMGKGN